MTCMVFVKAMAYFRGAAEVSFEDVRQMLPFVLHDKLAQNPDAPWFEGQGRAAYRIDHVSWIRNLFDLSCREYERLDLDRAGVAARRAQHVAADQVERELEEGLHDGVDALGVGLLDRGGDGRDGVGEVREERRGIDARPLAARSGDARVEAVAAALQGGRER